MFNPRFTLRFWLIALSLVAFVIQPVYAALAKSEVLWLPTNKKQGSVIKVEKQLPDTVKANETITYTIKVTNETENRTLLDVVVYEILPSSEDFEYQSATPSPIRRSPVAFQDLDKPKEIGGSPRRSRILTFRWDDDRLFYPKEERTITITGIMKRNNADLKALFAPRFCTAAQYVMGFCKGVTTAELKLFKEFENFVVDRNGNFVVDRRTGERVVEKVPFDGSVPKYPKLCKKLKEEKPLEYLRICAKNPKLCENAKYVCAKEKCSMCAPKNPELCTFAVKTWAKKTGTTAISDITINDNLDDPILIHNTGVDRIGPKSLSPVTLTPGRTTHTETRTLRAECSKSDVGTPAQARSANPVLNVDSNTPKINVTSPDLVVSATKRGPNAGETKVEWTIDVKNNGSRPATNVDVETNFSSQGVSGFSLYDNRSLKRYNITRHNETWHIDELKPGHSETYIVNQQLNEAKGFATVNVTATSNCDCAKADGIASSVNYAMVVEMIDLDDPFRPNFVNNEATIPYRLTVCNQVKDNKDESAFDFSFSGGLYSPDDSPVKNAVNSYYVKFLHIARLNDNEDVEGRVTDLHYQGVTKEGTFSKEWELGRKFRFGSELKGRHCARFYIHVRVNDSLAKNGKHNLANGKHSLRVNVNALDLPIPVPLEAKETEPTTVER